MLRALIFGGNGQDGRLITNHILDLCDQIHLVGRSFDDKHHHKTNAKVKFIIVDLLNCEIQELLNVCQPNLIFYCAAFHGPSGTVYEDSVLQSIVVNSKIPIEILEYCKKNIDTKFIYFNSSKAFNLSKNLSISEKSVREPNCIYSLEKEITYKTLAHFRNQYGVKAYNFWLFNHESILRPETFFIPTIINILKRSIHDPLYSGEVRSLDFYCDWGCANEYMKHIVNLVQNFEGDDYIIATGKTLSGHELVDKLFSFYGLNYRDHIVTTMQNGDLSLKRWCANIHKLTERSGAPCRSIFDVCEELMNAEEI